MARLPADKRFHPPIPALHRERDALLAAIREADERDEVPALVYADWQDEHDQPEHAELIRVMCEMDRSRTRDKKARRSVLLARMKQLFKTPALQPLRELESNTWSFLRGFVRYLTITVEYGLSFGPVRKRGVCGPPGQLDLPSYVPFDKVAWLGLMLPPDPTSGLMAVLAEQEWMQRVDTLEFDRWELAHIADGVFQPLFDSPHLGGVQSFHPHYATISADELVGLYTAKSTSGLRELMLFNLHGQVTRPLSRRPTHAAYLDAISRITSSPRAKRLVSLGEFTVEMDDKLARILLESRHLGGVKRVAYFDGGLSKRMKSRLVERFGPPGD